MRTWDHSIPVNKSINSLVVSDDIVMIVLVCTLKVAQGREVA